MFGELKLIFNFMNGAFEAFVLSQLLLKLFTQVYGEILFYDAFIHRLTKDLSCCHFLSCPLALTIFSMPLRSM